MINIEIMKCNQDLKLISTYSINKKKLKLSKLKARTTKLYKTPKTFVPVMT